MFFLPDPFDPNEEKRYHLNWKSIIEKMDNDADDTLDVTPPVGSDFFEIPVIASDLTLEIYDITVDAVNSEVEFWIKLTDKSKAQELVDALKVEPYDGYLTLLHNVQTTEGLILQRSVALKVEQL